MSSKRDHHKDNEGNYQKIIALLNKNEQGRSFLRRYVDNNEFAVDKMDQGLSSLQTALEHYQALAAQRDKLTTSMVKICDMLRTSSEQLRASGEQPILSRVLEDMIGQLEQQGKTQDEIWGDLSRDVIEQLQDGQHYFVEVQNLMNASENDIDEGLSPADKTSFI